MQTPTKTRDPKLKFFFSV